MNEDHFYIAETRLGFTGELYYEEIIETQLTNQETLIELGRGTELVFKNEKLFEIYDYYEENREVFRKRRQINEDELNYKKPQFQPKYILKFQESENGFHQIGGNFSEEFNKPSDKLEVSFQFLGFINDEDPNFSWLPFKLHLTYPIYLGVEEVFLDYSNNKNPKIFNIDELKKCKPILNEVNSKSEISFIAQRFDLDISNDYSLNVNSGIPNWVQGQHIPKCPKSGRKMKFVCQIYNGTKTEKSNIKPESEWNKNYFEKMEFFSSDLYVFIEPQSNMVCLFTQGT